MQVKSIAEGEHSGTLSAFIKLQVVIKTFVLFFLSGPFTLVILDLPVSDLYIVTTEILNTEVPIC